MKVLIGIINRGGDLQKCVDSCLNQSATVLIIDNSEDEVKIKSIKGAANYIIHNPSINSKNVAIEYAIKHSYDYLYCIYSDEYLVSGALNKLINFAKGLGYDIGGIYSDYYVYYTVAGEEEFSTREYLESCDSEKIWKRNIKFGNLFLNLKNLNIKYNNTITEYNLDFILQMKDKILAHFPEALYYSPFKQTNTQALYEVRQKYVNLYI